MSEETSIPDDDGQHYRSRQGDAGKGGRPIIRPPPPKSPAPKPPSNPKPEESNKKQKGT